MKRGLLSLEKATKVDKRLDTIVPRAQATECFTLCDVRAPAPLAVDKRLTRYCACVRSKPSASITLCDVRRTTRAPRPNSFGKLAS